MTREEAKRILQNSRKELIDYKGVNNSSAEALYVAIQSFEAWDNVKSEIAKLRQENIHDWNSIFWLDQALAILDKHLQEVEK